MGIHFWIEVCFWGSLFLLLYIYFGYALVLYLLSKIIPAKHASNEQYQPPVTILFAARNERTSLPNKLESIRQLVYPKESVQILIASDNSTDGTDEYLDQQNDVEWVSLQQHSGKNAALNTIVPQAKGEILFFTDANNLLHPQCLRKAIRHFADPHVGAVSGELIYTYDANWNAVGRGAGLYWRYDNWIKRTESRVGSLLVGAGSMLLCRKDLIGELDPRIANDLEIPTRIGAQGYQILYDIECLGFEKPHSDAGEEFHRTSRIVARGFRGFLVLFSQLLKSPLRFWQFISHKFLRWFTLVFCFLLLGSSWCLREEVFPFMVFWVGIIVSFSSLLGILFVGKKSVPRILRPFPLLAHLLIMNLAAIWGMLLCLFGHAPATWTIPKSTRNQL